jgi:hypothetical protein
LRHLPDAFKIYARHHLGLKLLIFEADPRRVSAQVAGCSLLKNGSGRGKFGQTVGECMHAAEQRHTHVFEDLLGRFVIGRSFLFSENHYTNDQDVSKPHKQGILTFLSLTRRLAWAWVFSSSP